MATYDPRTSGDSLRRSLDSARDPELRAAQVTVATNGAIVLVLSPGAALRICDFISSDND